ncbi:MAG: hypothetical protein KBG83_01075 [Bacteroidetes bacterium]|nr:hypothetical protein [Bacteroidota bacterium]
MNTWFTIGVVHLSCRQVILCDGKSVLHRKARGASNHLSHQNKYQPKLLLLV